MRVAARLNSAGCRAFPSSVEARHRGFAAGRRVRLYLAYKQVYGTWAWNGGAVLGMRVESQGRAWIPRPAPLGLGRLTCILGGLIRIYERTVRLISPHWPLARPDLGRAQKMTTGTCNSPSPNSRRSTATAARQMANTRFLMRAPALRRNKDELRAEVPNRAPC